MGRRSSPKVQSVVFNYLTGVVIVTKDSVSCLGLKVKALKCKDVSFFWG